MAAFKNMSIDMLNSGVMPMDEKDITDVYQLPSDMREGSDYLDMLIQLDLVKNMMEDKKKNKDEGQTFLNSYLA